MVALVQRRPALGENTLPIPRPQESLRTNWIGKWLMQLQKRTSKSVEVVLIILVNAIAARPGVAWFHDIALNKYRYTFRGPVSWTYFLTGLPFP